jgi:hypothetical protein
VHLVSFYYKNLEIIKNKNKKSSLSEFVYTYLFVHNNKIK